MNASIHGAVLESMELLLLQKPSACFVLHRQQSRYSPGDFNIGIFFFFKFFYIGIFNI